MNSRLLLAFVAAMAFGAQPSSAVTGQPFTPQLAGLLEVEPGTGMARYELRAPIPLPTLVLEAYGVSCGTVTVRGQVEQNGSFNHLFDLRHAGRLVVTLVGPEAADLDLAIYGPSGHLLALSATAGSSVERIEVRVPADGRWRLEVRGREVPAAWAEFDLSVEAIEGRDLLTLSVPSGPFAPGDTIPVELQLERKAAGCAVPRAILVWGPAGDAALDELVTVRTAGTPVPVEGRAP